VVSVMALIVVIVGVIMIFRTGTAKIIKSKRPSNEIEMKNESEVKMDF
jgi:uncharacterized integral membrane protein